MSGGWPDEDQDRDCWGRQGSVRVRGEGSGGENDRNRGQISAFSRIYSRLGTVTRNASPGSRDRSTSSTHSAPRFGSRSRNWTIVAVCLVGVMLMGGAWRTLSTSQQKQVPVYGVEILNVYPHDADAFTQGLEVVDGILFEGTGKYGNSKLRKVELETGKILKEIAIPSTYFGEGITVFKDRVYQLTWQERVAFVYDKESFELIRRDRYAGEGWGLTHDGQNLIMSDGSATLRFLDPETFRVVRTLRVTTPDGRPVDQLNELEYINGEILANLWNTSTIARISAKTGQILAWIDLSNVRPRQAFGSNSVLNGIAYDARNRRLFVTGKNWSDLFEIRLVPRS